MLCKTWSYVTCLASDTQPAAHPAPHFTSPHPSPHCTSQPPSTNSQDAAEASEEDAGPKLEEAQAFLDALCGEGGAAGASAPAEDEEDI